MEMPGWRSDNFFEGATETGFFFSNSFGSTHVIGSTASIDPDSSTWPFGRLDGRGILPLGSPLGTPGDALEALLKPFARHEADIWLSFGSAEMAEMPPASPSPQRFQMEAKCLPHALLGASKELHSVS